MLEPLILGKKQLTPEVILDKGNNTFSIKGKSIFSNGYEFYKPILLWFEEYFKNPNKETELTIYFEYINSSSFFQISLLIILFSKNYKKSNLKIIWLHDEDDEVIEENGTDFKEMTSFNFEVRQHVTSI